MTEEGAELKEVIERFLDYSAFNYKLYLCLIDPFNKMTQAGDDDIDSVIESFIEWWNEID